MVTSLMCLCDASSWRCPMLGCCCGKLGGGAHCLCHAPPALSHTALAVWCAGGWLAGCMSLVACPLHAPRLPQQCPTQLWLCDVLGVGWPVACPWLHFPCMCHASLSNVPHSSGCVVCWWGDGWWCVCVFCLLSWAIVVLCCAHPHRCGATLRWAVGRWVPEVLGQRRVSCIVCPSAVVVLSAATQARGA